MPGNRKINSEARLEVVKVFAELRDGETVLELTLAQILGAEVCGEIILVTRQGDEALAEKIARKVVPRHVSVRVITGGATRQQSVAHGLALVPSETDLVLVHDGARPFCSSEKIRAVCSEASLSGAAILAKRITGTVKRSLDGNFISETLNREELFEAQTPQVFRADILRAAHRRAEQEGFQGTDEAQLVERTGVAVRLVLSDDTNLKITTPGDLQIALALLEMGE